MKIVKGKLVIRAQDQVPDRIELAAPDPLEGAERINKIVADMKLKNKKGFTKFSK